MAKRSRRRLSKKELDNLQRIDQLIKQTQSDTQNNSIETVLTQTNYPVIHKAPSETPVVPYQHFNLKGEQIPLSTLSMSEHAYIRSIERLGLKRTERGEVESYIKKKLSQADYLGLVTAKNGNASEMFLIGNVSIHVNPELTNIVTVIKYDKLPYSPLNEKVKCVYQKEFRKLDRSERAKIKKLHLHTYETNLEISELNLRKYKTRSESIRLSCSARIKALESHVEALKEELTQIKKDKRLVATNLAMF